MGFHSYFWGNLLKDKIMNYEINTKTGSESPGQNVGSLPAITQRFTNKPLLFFLFFILHSFFFILHSSHAQRPTYGPAPLANDEKVFLLPGADSITFTRQPDGTEVRRVVNNVTFRHKGALMYCDLAIYNVGANAIEAYGKVRIVQNDTVTVTGDTLFYYGNQRLAKVSGKTVVLKDRKRTLTTTRLDYDMLNGTAYYPNQGKTIDAENTLTSTQGYYDTRTKVFTYYQNVKLVNKKYTLTTDTLVYNSISKLADFRSPTKVVSKDGVLVAKNGSYDTQTGESVFRTRTTIDNPDYTLTGDSLTFDNLNKRGFAKGNVELVAKNDKTFLNGDFGQYDGRKGRSKVWGHALTRTVMNDDTLFMVADTLYSIEIQADTLRSDSTSKKIASNLRPTPPDTTDDKQKPRKLIGTRNVQVIKKDFQSKSDSLIYNTLDSTITFLKKPILWANQYQLEADSIVAFMVQQKLRRLHLRAKAFVIAQDTLLNFNQVKGRRITAYLDDSTRLQKVYVEGNGESIYYALNDKNKSLGMNRVDCSKMTLNFKRNRVRRIQFVGQPDGKFIPPQEVKGDQKELDGFSWRTQEKPTRKQVFVRANWKPPVATKPEKPSYDTPKVVESSKKIENPQKSLKKVEKTVIKAKKP
jgi:lipopolysaccharide export system protein LptA